MHRRGFLGTLGAAITTAFVLPAAGETVVPPPASYPPHPLMLSGTSFHDPKMALLPW